MFDIRFSLMKKTIKNEQNNSSYFYPYKQLKTK